MADNQSHAARTNLSFEALASTHGYSDNSLMASLQQEAQSLVDAGLMRVEDLQNLAVRVLDYQAPNGVEAAHDRIADFALKPELASEEGHSGVIESSHFDPRYDALTINGVEAEKFGQSLPTEDALREVWRHELGHAVTSVETMDRTLHAAAEHDTATGLPDDIRHTIADLGSGKGPTAHTAPVDGEGWYAAAQEMTGDVFQEAATLHLEGHTNAERNLNITEVFRTDEQREALEGAGPQNNLVEAHHTNAALDAFEKLHASGAAAQMLHDGHGRELVAQAVFEGLAQEVIDKTASQMNVHHFDKEGHLVPGLPEGVTKEDVAFASLRGELPPPGAGLTVLMPTGTMEAMSEQGVEMSAGTHLGHPPTTGRDLATQDIPSIAGFEAFSSNTPNVELHDHYSGHSEVFAGNTPVQNYLAERGEKNEVLDAPPSEVKTMTVDAYYNSMARGLENETDRLPQFGDPPNQTERDAGHQMSSAELTELLAAHESAAHDASRSHHEEHPLGAPASQELSHDDHMQSGEHASDGLTHEQEAHNQASERAESEPQAELEMSH